MFILGIETSCDDTSAAVLENDTVLSNVISSQDSVHCKFGGVVPELASRSHLQAIHPVVHSALEQAHISLNDLDLIAVTQGPGLVGSLLVGFSYSRALAAVNGIPLVGVDHMAGHILSVFLGKSCPEFPYIALIVSGGTSSIYLAKSFTDYQCLGRTRDDAAGEAFDKVAKLLGLPYPGGPHVSNLAEQGSPDSIAFPRSWLEKDSFDFSFSGLKTAVLNFVNMQQQKNITLPMSDICSSFEDAVVEVLVTKTLKAAEHFHVDSIVLGGGVSANKSLRHRFQKQCESIGKNFHAPDLCYCTDNGAMIGVAGMHIYQNHGPLGPDQDVYSRSSLG